MQGLKGKWKKWVIASIEGMVVEAWPRGASSACLIGNADTRVVQHAEGAHQAWPLVMGEFNELESMKVVCMCVCV